MNIIIYLFFFLYILFSSYKHVFTYYLFTICTRCRVARDRGNSNSGGEDTDHHAIYLSILFRFAISSSSFDCLFSEQEKEAKRRTDGECTRLPEKRIRESISLKRSQPRRFRSWREASGEGRRERRTRKRSNENAKTPQLASPEKLPLFTLIHSFPLVVHHTFHSVHPFHRFPEILEYRRSIFLKRVYQNDYENDERYCQANYDEHQFLRTKYRELPSLVDVTHRSRVERNERDRESR